jgi:hypothetical protein
VQFKPDKQRDVLDFVRQVNQRPITLEEAKQAKEVFMVGSATVVHALFHCLAARPCREFACFFFLFWVSAGADPCKGRAKTRTG